MAKIDPPRGALPVLQYVPPHQLQVDPGYQRSIEVRASQKLIDRITRQWNWDLCQPLVVSRRANGDLYVVDGQHRLMAAKARGDIAQLPCVIGNFESADAEAASFVEFNQARRPLSKHDLFRAALASGDRDARAIIDALDAVGMKLHPNSNNHSAPPGSVTCVATLQHLFNDYGQYILIVALDVLQEGFKGQQLRYAGSLLTGIAALVRTRLKATGKAAAAWQDDDEFILLTELLGAQPQADWYVEIMKERATGSISQAAASARVLHRAWAEAMEEDQPLSDGDAEHIEDDETEDEDA